MNKPFLLSVILFLCIFNSVSGQIPSTSLILFDFTHYDGSFDLSNARFLTSFNKGNYNNQPALFDANTIYFSAILGDEEQTDIVAMDLLRKKYWSVTNTKSGEYSPTLMPNENYFSVIKQENKTNIQRLWEYPRNQSGPGQDIFPNITGVGYHAWIDAEWVAMFIVGDPHKLILANRTTKESRTVIDRIGRGLKVNKDGLLFFVHKVTDQSWYLKSYNMSSKQITTITEMPGLTEDIEILKDGTIISGLKSKLFVYHPLKSISWREIADLKEYDVDEITRISVLGNKLVLVSN